VCEIVNDPSLDADNDGKLDSCENAELAGASATCGLCGGGATALMPLAFLGLTVAGIRRRL